MSGETPLEFSIALSSEEATVAVAERIAPLLVGGDLLICSGGLGAGKTFFARALCHALGLPEDEPVTSPTYTLVHEYPTEPPIDHADLYRLSEPDEVFDLGLDVRREQGHLLVVEWGAPFVQELGGAAIFLDMQIEPRSLCLHGESPRAQQIIKRLNEKGVEAG